MRFAISVKTVSEANVRVHWAVRARRAKAQRGAACLLTREAMRGAVAWTRAKVRLTRVAPGRLDSDNLAGALKAIRDGIADALGLDDGDNRLRWAYGQRKGPRGTYGVEVEILLDTRKAIG